MNKFGVVLGIAAVATLAGCKDPDFHRTSGVASQNDVKRVDTTPAPAQPVEIEPAPAKCMCPPGTKHTAPCTCGASDCKCVVETKPVLVADVSKPAAPAEPEYTVYIVQNGDYLAKISKKFNVTIASIKRLNPSIKNDVVRVGQKLKLPGKIDVGVQAAPVTAAAKNQAAKKGYAPYAGATKEYVVKSGDTLGAIAYGNGINIRQLKELNGLSSDSLKVGQKLKIPAEKVVKAAPAKAAAPVAKKEKPVVAAAAPVAAPVEATKPAEAAPAVAEAAPEAAKAADASAEAAKEATPAKPDEAAAPATTTYVVQEGDDMTSVSIRWGVAAAAIRELNNMADGDQLVPGQIIKLPADAQQ